jgi:hypothetical protein
MPLNQCFPSLDEATNFHINIKASRGTLLVGLALIISGTQLQSLCYP